MHKTRVLVADKNEMLVHSFKLLVQKHIDIEIAAAGTTLESLYASVQSKPFEVLLLDENLLHPDTPAVLKRLYELKSKFRLVILTHGTSASAHTTPTLAKNASVDQLLATIRNT